MSEGPNPQSSPALTGDDLVWANLRESRRLRRLKHRPPNTLPVRPCLEYYVKRARELHKAEREQDSSSKLHSAQFAVARGLGLSSWRKLVAAIQSRDCEANELSIALAQRDAEAIRRIVGEHPLALLDVGSVAPPDELGLLLEVVPVSRHDSKLRTALLDAVAEHHDPEGLEECVRLLTDWSDVDPDYADDTIKDRWQRAEASPNGARAAELLENALGVLSWLTDPPDYSEYMSEDD